SAGFLLPLCLKFHEREQLVHDIFRSRVNIFTLAEFEQQIARGHEAGAPIRSGAKVSLRVARLPPRQTDGVISSRSWERAAGAVMGPVKLIVSAIRRILSFPLVQLIIVVAIILFLQAADPNSAFGKIFNGLDELVESTVG